MNNAKYAFYYLLSLVALVFVAISSGMVVFQIINQTVVDGLADYSGRVNQEALRFAIASLVFAAPVYFWMLKLIKNGLAKKEIAVTDGIKRWLTYLIIFVASVIMLVWLIMTLNNFLNGQLTVNFALKTLTVLVIAGVTFGYYFYDAKRQVFAAKDKVRFGFFIGSLVLLAAIFTASWFFLDKPSLVRDQRHDQTVINNLQEIDSAVSQYYEINKKLPTDINELLATNGLYLRAASLNDPVTKTAYVYRVLDEKSYELCANFKLASDDQDKTDYYGSTWRRQAGEQCFKKVIGKGLLEAESKALVD